MPTDLTLAQHLDGLRAATVALSRYADEAGLAATVPTCPGWTVRDLVAHVGMAHRWSSASLRLEKVADPDAWEREGQASDDLVGWLEDGVIELVETIVRASDDVPAMVFLREAPAPKAFWARRQCHETTIHAVDALAAALGRYPVSAETWIGDDIAADGVEELVVGFLQRSKTRLRADPVGTQVVALDGAASPAWWSMALTPDAAPVTTRHPADEPVEPGDWTLTGPAVDVYLQLWNRHAVPDGALAPDWPTSATIVWS
jgi:uncharacterized protein (TIGR03083 family)